jgi:hypothetical protein
VVYADFSIADGERSRNGEDGCGGTIECDPEIERMKIWGGAFGHKSSVRQWLTDCAVSHSHSSPRDASLCPYSHTSIVFYPLATPSRHLSSTIVFLSFPYMSEQPLPSAPVCLSQTCSKNIANSYTACWCFPQSTLFVRRSCQCEANGSAPGFYLRSR